MTMAKAKTPAETEKREQAVTPETETNEVQEQVAETEASGVQNLAVSGLLCRVDFCGALNLRSAPSMAAEVVAKLPVGTQVRADPMGRWAADGKQLWVGVDLDDGTQGYAMGAYLVPVGE